MKYINRTEITIIISGLFLFYIVVCAFVDRFSNPHLTETQLLLHFPHALILDFDA